MGEAAHWQHNQIPLLQAGQPTNQKIIISQRCSNRSESSESQIGLPSLGYDTGSRSPQSTEGQWGLIIGMPQDWEKESLHSWKVHIRSHMHWDPGKKVVTSQEPGTELFAGVREPPGVVGWGQLWLTTGAGTLVVELPGSTHWHDLSWRLPF